MITECRKIKTRSGLHADVRDARRPRRDGRAHALREGRWPATKPPWRSTRSSSSRGAWIRGSRKGLRSSCRKSWPSSDGSEISCGGPGRRAAAAPRLLNLPWTRPRLAPTCSTTCGALFEDYPGDCELVLEMRTQARARAACGWARASASTARNAALKRALAPARPAVPARAVVEAESRRGAAAAAGDGEDPVDPASRSPRLPARAARPSSRSSRAARGRGSRARCRPSPRSP
jgi:hypothetical protein